jgi:deoxyadenosine/deoxycytidine kinase
VIIWLSGPTGSGKSTLAGHLAKVGYLIVRENLPTALFQQFREDPVAHCAELQEAIMRGRGEEWARVSNRSRVAFDRSVDEDFAVFCRMHAETGLIDEAAMSRLESVATTVRADFPPPDMILYLRPQTSILRERIEKVGHPSVICETLHRQIDLYDEWAAQQSASMLRIDNGAAEIGSVTKFFESFHPC